MNKLRDRVFNKTTVVVFLLSAMSLSAWSDPNSIYNDPWYAPNIVKKDGVKKPVEVLEWKKDPKSIPSDWLKVNNKNFTASYPKCIEAHGTSELYDHPETSETVGFIPTKCPGFDEKTPPEVSLSIEPSRHNKKIETGEPASPIFMVQDIKLNGHNAKMYVKGFSVGEKPKENIQLHWSIYVDCNKKTMYFGSSSESGNPTVELIEKKNYQFPEFFKQIVETFECNEF